MFHSSHMTLLPIIMLFFFAHLLSMQRGAIIASPVASHLALPLVPRAVLGRERNTTHHTNVRVLCWRTMLLQISEVVALRSVSAFSATNGAFGIKLVAEVEEPAPHGVCPEVFVRRDAATTTGTAGERGWSRHC